VSKKLRKTSVEFYSLYRCLRAHFPFWVGRTLVGIFKRISRLHRPI